MKANDPRRRLFGLAALVAVLVVALQLLGAYGLPTPPIAHPDHLTTWVRRTDTAVVGFAFVRLGALAAGWYLLVVVVLQALATMRPGRLRVAVARLVTVPALRRALVNFAGVGLTASAVGVLPATATTARGALPLPRRPVVAIATPAAAARLDGATARAYGFVAVSRDTSPPGTEPPEPGPHGTPADHDHTAHLRRLQPGDPGTVTIRRLPPTSRASARHEATSPTTRPSNQPESPPTTTSTGHARQERDPSPTAPRHETTPTTRPTPPTASSANAGDSHATDRRGTDRRRTDPHATRPHATRRDAGRSDATNGDAAGEASPSTATLRRVPPATRPNDAQPSVTPPPARHGPTPRTAEHGGGTRQGAATYTVRPGDNFWQIACDALRGAWGREPSDAEVDNYWRALVRHNLDRLARPGQPDLIFVGQVFELPALPSAP